MYIVSWFVSFAATAVIYGVLVDRSPDNFDNDIRYTPPMPLHRFRYRNDLLKLSLGEALLPIQWCVSCKWGRDVTEHYGVMGRRDTHYVT